MSIDILTGEITEKSGVEKGSSIVGIFNETGFIGIIFFIILILILIKNLNFNKKDPYEQKITFHHSPLAFISFAMIIESFVSSWLYSVMGPGFNIMMYNVLGFYLLLNNTNLVKN